MPNSNRRKWPRLTLALLALTVLILLVRSQFAPHPREDPLPKPNGYDDFIAAGRMMGAPATNSTAEGLRQFVNTNRAALDLTRLGLTRPCQVPTDYSTNAEAYLEEHATDLGAIKTMAQALRSEGRLAELEEKPMEAARDYLACVKLGLNVAHGGVMIDALGAILVESYGVESLEAVLTKLDRAGTLEVLRQLQELEAGRESKQSILQHEERMGSGLARGGISYILVKTFLPAFKKSLDAVSNKYDAQRRRTQDLELTLAARAFELEKGGKPLGWDNLVPAYLKEIPKDPSTQKVLEWPRVFP